MQGMEDEFQFLLCEKCRRAPQNPKLLGCLHTLCSECISESKPVGHCPVCGVSVPRFQDNLLFTHLQAHLNTYQQITAGKDLVCSRCKTDAEYWCAECQEFLCVACYAAHQWYLKQKSHEAQKIGDVKVDSLTRFLAGARNSCTLFCSNPAHSSQGQISSIYCRQCQKPLCCSCALLDSGHSEFYCDISVEIQQRKEELGRMSEELQRKEQCYEQTYGHLQQRVHHMEQVRDEIQDLVREKVEEMIQLLRQNGDRLVEEVDNQLHQERQDTQGKLQAMERILSRMRIGKQLVENMAAFASDQEVMDMHPFIKESLEELKKEKVPIAGLRVPMKNFAEVKDKLQALCRKVMGPKDTASTSHVPSSSQTLNMEVPCNDTDHEKAHGSPVPKYTLSIEKNLQGFTPSITTSRKRPLDQCEKSIQASPKIPKHEDDENQEGETSTGSNQDIVVCLPGAHEMTPCAHEMILESDRRVTANLADADCSPREIGDSEIPSIVISSSDETDADTM